jgi:DNA-binding NarL/FixJ family response regulator
MNDCDIQKATMVRNPIRIAVFDDHPVFREGVVQMLKRVDGFEIVGEGATATDALRIAQERAPDVILLDLCMPGGSIEAAACIACDCSNVRTMMLTVSEREHDLVSALLAGARGYVLKGSRESEIVDAVRAVARGDFYFTSNLVVRVLIERGKRIENGRQRRSSVTSPFARSNSFRLCRGQYPN